MLNNNYEIESSVLGLIFQYQSLNEKINSLTSEDFRTKEFRTLFNLFKSVYNEYLCIDHAVVLTQLDPEQTKLLLYSAELAINPSMIDNYIDLLKEASRRSRLSNAVNDLVFSDECTVNNLQKVIDDELKIGTSIRTEQKSLKNYDEFLANFGKEKKLLKTGFQEIDFMVKGLEKGTFFIIGARPSTGKTTFALNIAVNQIKMGHKILFFSLEMTAAMIFERLISNYLNMDYSAVSQNKLSKEETEKVRKQISRIKEQNNFLVIDDTYAVENICNQIMEVKPEIAVVDFIQIISTLSDKWNNLREKVNYISSELKRVAKRTGCIVIALSQVTRMGKDAPTMSDLRESGALEQDGDYIVMLHRPYVADKRLNDEKETEVMFDKNKFGWTGRFDFNFDAVHQRFTSIYNSGEAVSTSDGDLPFD